MARKDRAPLRKFRRQLLHQHPSVIDPDGMIRRGDVLVDGSVITNPDSLIPADATIVLRSESPLRGEVKLRAALQGFGVQVEDRIALDAGAAAGGFTRVLLEAGVRRVYAVDAGHGQLLGSLRQDPRVVNLEKTNLGELNGRLVPDPIEIVTLDLSYLSLRDAIPQLDRVDLAKDAKAIALVKPQFELGLATPPRDEWQLREAVERAARAFGEDGWLVIASMSSPVPGRRGSTEFFLYASRRGQEPAD